MGQGQVRVLQGTSVLVCVQVTVFLALYVLSLAGCASAKAAPATAPAVGSGQAGEVLYNGIVLPKPWPPRLLTPPADPVTPPYLAAPPKVIPIDVGRQLFVDDFLIHSTTLMRTFHQAEYYPANPVYSRMPFSGGIWYDPKDQLIKLFAGPTMATSHDGIHFENPVPDSGNATVWLDQNATDPNKRWVNFELQNVSPGHKENIYRYFIHFSPDGVHWSDAAAQSGNYYGDRSSGFYNPFRKVWVYSIRWGWSRMRKYWEVKNLVDGPYWPDWSIIAGKLEPAGEAFTRLSFHRDPPSSLTDGRPNYWTGADSADYVRPDLGDKPQLYNFDAVAYESLMLGYYSIWRGEPDYRMKICDVCLGFSRDGFHFDRPDRRPFLPVDDRYGTWNWVNVQSVGGGCLVMGDTLYFYCSGRSSHGNVTGLATLRRDGFASMDAADKEGTLTTRPLTFAGKRLFVNVDCPQGELTAEVLDQKGHVIKGFTKAACMPVRVNRTLQEVTWKGVDDLSSLAGQPVQFRFHLTHGKLYAFWVSPDAAGASLGFVAAGGPGFTSERDTVGKAAYEVVNPPAAAGSAPAPLLWPVAGAFNGAVKVTLSLPLSAAADEAIIRYTRDGSDPDERAARYEAPLAINHTATIKARAFAKGAAPSAVAAEKYTINPPLPIEADNVPPVRTNGGPKTMLPAGSKVAVLHLVTHENAICKYATKPGVSYDEMDHTFLSTGGLVHATAVSEGLADGKVVTFYIKARDLGGHTNPDDYRLDVVINEAGSASAPIQIALGPKDATLVAPMMIEADANALGGEVVVCPVKPDANTTAALAAEGITDSPNHIAAARSGLPGTATWTFSVPRAGDYAIWARAIAPHYRSDSFFYSMDGGPEDTFLMEPIWEKWVWRTVGMYDGLHVDVRPARLFPLTQGEHTLVFRSKKPGCRLACLVVTNDPTLGPQGDKLVAGAAKTWPQRENPVGGAGPADPGSAPTGADGKLIAPVIYPAGGMMTAPMLVAFSWPIVSAPEQTQIRYTTDGSEPSEQSTLYSAPFQVSQTCTVKARAFRTGLAAPSAVAAADFMRKSKTTPPVISAGEPTSLLPAGTRQVKIEVTTSEWAMCRYGLQRGGPFERMTPMVSAGGISHSQTLGDLADGQVKTIYVKARDGSGNVTADDYVITVGVADAAAAEPAVIPLAVKEAKLTAPMAAAEEEEKSFVSSSQANKGEAVFTFTAPVTGQYVVWARIFGPDYHSDSFFVSLDGAGEDAFDAAENAWGQWHWIRVNGRDNREVAKLDPRLFILSKGEHTLTFRGREPGCKLEKIIITNDMKYAPPKE